MLLRWNATVRLVTNSAAPASWLVRPSATRRATASSCVVSSSAPARGGRVQPGGVQQRVALVEERRGAQVFEPFVGAAQEVDGAAAVARVEQVPAVRRLQAGAGQLGGHPLGERHRVRVAARRTRLRRADLGDLAPQPGRVERRPDAGERSSSAASAASASATRCSPSSASTLQRAPGQQAEPVDAAARGRVGVGAQRLHHRRVVAARLREDGLRGRGVQAGRPTRGARRRPPSPP